MDPNFDRMRQRFNNVPGSRGFNAFRRQFHRSSNGKLLGVFSGIAESKGYCVSKVRWFGVVALIFLATAGADVHGFKATVLVCGFFYLLLALFMQSPRASTDGMASAPMPPRPDSDDRGYRRGGAVPYPGPTPTGGGMRPDFAQIDRQLDGLNRRIQRMETIVTDRQYDWERRMGS